MVESDDMIIPKPSNSKPCPFNKIIFNKIIIIVSTKFKIII